MHCSEILTFESDQKSFGEEAIQLEQAAKILDLESWIVERLRHAEREITVNLPLICDDGRAVTISGYRVQHSTLRGPMLGGLRVCGDATIADARARAMDATWQLALLDAPFGGSVGAIVCDPVRLSERELRHVVKEYVAALRGNLGAHTDVILQGDGCNAQMLAWILDACCHTNGHLEPAAVIGKPRALFGLEGHRAAVAHGIAIVVERIASDLKLGHVRVAIQNLSDYGHLLAHCCDQRGMEIVALADSSGGTYSADGIAVSSLTRWLDEHGGVIGYPDAESVCNTDVLGCDCDVLIAAMPGSSISASVAESIRAPLVIEGVYGAISAAAGDVLESRGTTLVPHVLAGAGGLAQACLEWTVNTSGHVLLAGEAEEHLQRRMQRAYSAAQEASQRYAISLREATYVAAIELVADAMRLR